MNERDHRKLVVLDGRIALLGGHCIVDTWLGNAEDKEHFADLSVRLQGPIVNSVQAAFSENWVGQTGELFMGDDVFPQARARRHDHHPCGVREAGRLGAHRQDPAPHRDLLRQEANLDPEPLLHPRARGNRGVRQSRRQRRRRAGPDAFYQRLGQSDGAARRASQFREAAALWRAAVRVSVDAAASESDDDRRRVVRDRIGQFRRPVVRDQRRDHAELQRRRDSEAARRGFREVLSALPRDQVGGVAQAGLAPQAPRQCLLPRSTRCFD